MREVNSESEELVDLVLELDDSDSEDTVDPDSNDSMVSG